MDATFFENLALWSEVVGGFAFVIALIALFRRLLLPVIRSTEIAHNHELTTAEKRREALREEVARARERLEEATREAAAIAERARADAHREQESIISHARREGIAIIKNAEGELERARIASRDRLRVEFIDRALARARSLATERVDAALDARLVARTVDELTTGKVV